MYKITAGASLFISFLSALMFIWATLAASFWISILVMIVGILAAINFVDDLEKVINND